MLFYDFSYSFAIILKAAKAPGEESGLYLFPVVILNIIYLTSRINPSLH